MDASASLSVPPNSSYRIAAAIDAGVIWFAQRWALSLTLLIAPIVCMPVVAPLLETTGNHRLASAIYIPYGLVCHQRPDRSFHVGGEQVAWCERDFAIATTLWIAMMLMAVVPRLRFVRSAPLRVAIIASIPLAVDGVTQLVGLRESTWELRVVTGAIFALGWSWFALPRLEGGFQDVTSVVEARRSGERK